MAIESRFTKPIEEQAKALLEDAANFCNFIGYPENSIVSIALSRGMINALNQQCDKVDLEARKRIEEILQKAEKKLQFADEVMDYALKRAPHSLDPRVEKLYQKILQRKQTPLPQQEKELPTVYSKLLSWYGKLGIYSAQCCSNQDQTAQKIETAFSLVSEIEMRLLSSSPQAATLVHSLSSDKNNTYYKGLKEIESCKKMASAAYAQNYLAYRIGVDDLNESRIHQWTAQYIKTNDVLKISVDDVLQHNPHPLLVEVPLLAAEGPEQISFFPDAKTEEIQKQIDALIRLKDVYELNVVGASIENGSRIVVIICQASGRISLFNPYTNKLGGASYEINCANSKQAAEHLKKMIGKMNSPDKITLKPYCYRKALQQSESDEPESSQQLYQELSKKLDTLIST